MSVTVTSMYQGCSSLYAGWRSHWLIPRSGHCSGHLSCRLHRWYAPPLLVRQSINFNTHQSNHLDMFVCGAGVLVKGLERSWHTRMVIAMGSTFVLQRLSAIVYYNFWKRRVDQAAAAAAAAAVPKYDPCQSKFPPAHHLVAWRASRSSCDCICSEIVLFQQLCTTVHDLCFQKTCPRSKQRGR
jgi:hypothetical protein